MLMQTPLKIQMQAIYDRVSQHLLTQMEQCMKGEWCLYRGPNRMKCAIGTLIPDELYTYGLEGRGAGSDEVMNVLEVAGVIPHDNRDEMAVFLGRLQIIHDDHHPSFWEKQLEGLAEDYELRTCK